MRDRLGDGRVLALNTMHGRGRGSGMELDERLATLQTFRGGRMVRTRFYWGDWSRALEEAGVSESEYEPAAIGRAERG